MSLTGIRPFVQLFLGHYTSAACASLGVERNYIGFVKGIILVLKVRTEGEKLALLEAARQRCYELSVSSA